MLLNGMIFSEVVHEVCWSFFPLKIKLMLGLAAFEPVELHVHGFWCFGNHCINNEAMCQSVISCDNHFGLVVTHFLECLLQEQGILTIVEESCKFSFRCGRHNMSDDYCQGEDSTIVWCIAIMVSEEVVSPYVAFPVRFRQEADIWVHS